MIPSGTGPARTGDLSAWLVGRTAPGWAELLPGLGLAPARSQSTAHLLLTTGQPRPRGSRTMLRLQAGPLQTPRFLPDPPWLSAALAGGVDARGDPLPGSAEKALLAAFDDPATLRRAADGAARMVRHRIGGSAWADPPAAALLARPGLGLAVVQCTGDAGQDRPMLARVLARHDAARIVVADAPPPLAAWAAKAGCRVLPPAPFDPWPLIELADELHVAAPADLGLLGLLAGRAVHAHAAIWYAGWGATEDAPDIAPRDATRGGVPHAATRIAAHRPTANRSAANRHAANRHAAHRSAAQIAAAWLVQGASYRDPFTGKPTQFEAALDIAADWRRTCDANRGIAGCMGMQFWKRSRIGAFLHTGTRPPPHGAAALAAVRTRRGQGSNQGGQGGGAIAAWASRMPPGLQDSLRDAGVPVLRVEDGFLRSVGLGSDFLPPCSIILDGRGIYYDPSRPSDLEVILAETAFSPALLSRAEVLVRRLVQAGVTKYNTGAADLPALPAGRRLVLVPGQVADDLSVRLGSGAVASNLALLQAVRAAAPDAFILYKPHPDVDAGHRPGAVPDTQALEVADLLVRGVPMATLIGAVQEVHTLTSLTGFEALLRGRAVTCWGQPFYAGWGLTQDMAPLPRRNRILTMPQLAAGVLLLYPRYLDPVTGLPCPAEVLLDRLADPAVWRVGPLVQLRRAQGFAAAGIARIRAAAGAAERTKP